MDVDYRPDEEVDETCRPNVTESPSHVSNHSPQSIKETDRKEVSYFPLILINSQMRILSQMYTFTLFKLKVSSLE